MEFTDPNLVKGLREKAPKKITAYKYLGRVFDIFHEFFKAMDYAFKGDLIEL